MAQWEHNEESNDIQEQIARSARRASDAFLSGAQESASWLGSQLRWHGSIVSAAVGTAVSSSSWFGGNRDEKKQDGEGQPHDLSVLDMFDFEHLGDQSPPEVVKAFVGDVMKHSLFSRMGFRRERLIWSGLARNLSLVYPNDLQDIDLSAEPDYDEMRYAVRHAIMVYPPSYRVIMGVDSIKCLASSYESYIAKAFSLPGGETSVLRVHLGNAGNIFRPKHYVCIDHNRQSIVITIRGTISLSDVLTDITFKSVPFEFDHGIYLVHDGILQSAKFLRDEIEVYLADIKARYPGYRLLLTGHSLGAGVAIILGFMFAEHPVLSQNLHVYAFSPACCVSHNLSVKGIPFVTSIIKGTDVISRLSPAAIMKFNRRLDLIHQVIDQKNGLLQRLKHEEYDGETMEFLSSIFDAGEECMSRADRDGFFYPTGRVILCVPGKSVNKFANDEWMTVEDEKEKAEVEVEVEENENNDGEPQGELDIAVEDEEGEESVEVETPDRFCDATNCLKMFDDLVFDEVDSMKFHMIRGMLRMFQADLCD